MHGKGGAVGAGQRGRGGGGFALLCSLELSLWRELQRKRKEKERKLIEPRFLEAHFDHLLPLYRLALIAVQ